MRDCAKANSEIREQTPRLDDGKLRVPFLSVHEAADYGWVRTAAQAAIALRIHGMLETTGMPSASARLQHASLPQFAAHRRYADDFLMGSGSEHQKHPGAATLGNDGAIQPTGFEDGVVQVSSELRKASPETDVVGLTAGNARKDTGDRDGDDDDDGYDLLPLPVPAPERRILVAGSTSSTVTRHVGASSATATYNTSSTTVTTHR